MELFEELFVKMTQIEYVASLSWQGLGHGNLYQNCILGGVDAEGKPADNETSLAILDAQIDMQMTQPTLSVWYDDSLSERFLLKAVQCVKTGCGYPAFFNQKTYVEHERKTSGLPLGTIRKQAAIGGCTEPVLQGMSYGVVQAGFVNHGKLLDLAINDGVDPLTQIRLFELAGAAELRRHPAVLHRQDARCHPQLAAVLELRDARPPQHGAVGVLLGFRAGLPGTRPVHGRRRRDPEPHAHDPQLGHGERGQFPGRHQETVLRRRRLQLRDAPPGRAGQLGRPGTVAQEGVGCAKWGNDDDYVDSIFLELFGDYCGWVRGQDNYLGEPYDPSMLAISTPVPFGKACAAFPDGRKAFEPLADGVTSPFPGTDEHGPTAVIRSSSKVDHTQIRGGLLNLKFHPSALQGDRGARNLLALVKTYFDKPGFHLQFNVVDSRMLLDAQAHPENYRDLVVRVAGFSAYWVEMSKPLQDQVIWRTEHRL